MFGFGNKSKAEREFESEEVKTLRKQLKTSQDETTRLTREKSELVHTHELAIKSLEAAHVIELKEKKFEIEHIADERVQKAESEKIAIEKKLAVAEKENELLHKAVDTNAAIIDVKDLVAQLIEKLPEVNIKSLSVVQTSGPQ